LVSRTNNNGLRGFGGCGLLDIFLLLRCTYFWSY
jgi:hypothetical protein